MPPVPRRRTAGLCDQASGPMPVSCAGRFSNDSPGIYSGAAHTIVRARSGEREAGLPGVALPLGSAPRSRPLRRHRQRLPPGNRPHPLPRLGIVGEAGEAAAQLSSGRQLAVPVVDSPDRGGIGLGDDERPKSMGRLSRMGKDAATLAASEPPGRLQYGRPYRKIVGPRASRAAPRVHWSIWTACTVTMDAGRGFCGRQTA